MNIKLEEGSLVSVNDTTVRRYIRFGLNQNNGKDQTDIFLIDKNGNIDANTPILWDFNAVSEMTCLLIDKKN